MIDWPGLERAAKVFAGTGSRIAGGELVALRSSVLRIVNEASDQVEREAGMTASPSAELMVVDRHGWIGGNVRTLERMFEGVALKGAEARLVAWEAGAFVGLMARAVLGQYDPFRDALVVVYPNLGDMADPEGLRYLLFHEVTHVAQFRAAPWIADEILEAGRSVLAADRPGLAREMVRRLPEQIPRLIGWARDVLEGKATTTPIFDLLPDDQRETIMRVHALVTLLEGHATYVADLIAERSLAGYEDIRRRIAARRRRPPLVRLLEALAGIDMKRQQYATGRGFCEEVWAAGGPAALEPAWRGPEWAPTTEELVEPKLWLGRVAHKTPA